MGVALVAMTRSPGYHDSSVSNRTLTQGAIDGNDTVASFGINHAPQQAQHTDILHSLMFAKPVSIKISTYSVEGSKKLSFLH